jgi:Amt family ammonium transporter
MIFIFIWTTIVYDPVTYWTWGAHGWLKNLGCLDKLDCGVGAIDYAGGGPIHVSSGFAGLAFTLFLGKNKKLPPAPHNVTMVYLGTILLWFGWFGFNGGSALASTPRAASSALVTTIAASFGSITWITQDYLMGPRKVTGVGFCSGVLAGLGTFPFL